jgi:alkanesulfonate monooxygenase SsuD/methylene tetrahydromethanopterin reductase-like flavin-dependent oxidoreductase (luciferase family)
VKIGVTLPVFTGDVDVVLDGARRARDAGLDSVWMFDHMWPLSGGKERPILECYSTLAYLASITADTTIGTLVTRSTLRNPVVLAKMAATVSAIAPGRLVVGIGSGDAVSKDENDAYGFPYLAGGARAEQLEETVTIVRDHLNGRGVLPAGPHPSRPPRVWVGGRSAAALAIAGRSADGWNCWGGTPEAFARERESVVAAAEGRDVDLTWAGLAVIGTTDAEASAGLGTRDPARYLVGGPDSLAAQLGELAAAGCSHAILTFPDASRRGSFELLGEVRRHTP